MYQRLYSTSGKLGWPILWNVTKGLVVAHQGLSKIYSKLYWTFQQIEIKPRELFELFKSRQEQNGSLKSCHNFRESQFVSIILHSAANLAMRVKLKEDLTKKKEIVEERKKKFPGFVSSVRPSKSIPGVWPVAQWGHWPPTGWLYSHTFFYFLFPIFYVYFLLNFLYFAQWGHWPRKGWLYSHTFYSFSLF